MGEEWKTEMTCAGEQRKKGQKHSKQIHHHQPIAISHQPIGVDHMHRVVIAAPHIHSTEEEERRGGEEEKRREVREMGTTKKRGEWGGGGVQARVESITTSSQH